MSGEDVMRVGVALDILDKDCDAGLYLQAHEAARKNMTQSIEGLQVPPGQPGLPDHRREAKEEVINLCKIPNAFRWSLHQERRRGVPRHRPGQRGHRSWWDEMLVQWFDVPEEEKPAEDGEGDKAVDSDISSTIEAKM
jgi:hypothetical protein